jgi:hypothetical protein
MVRVLQWVALGGAVCKVALTTAWIFRDEILGMRPGRGASFSNPPQRRDKKTFPPELNRGARNPKMMRDVVAEDSTGCHLDDFGALHQARRKAFPASPQCNGPLFLGG